MHLISVAKEGSKLGVDSDLTLLGSTSLGFSSNFIPIALHKCQNPTTGTNTRYRTNNADLRRTMWENSESPLICSMSESSCSAGLVTHVSKVSCLLNTQVYHAHDRGLQVQKVRSDQTGDFACLHVPGSEYGSDFHKFHNQTRLISVDALQVRFCSSSISPLEHEGGSRKNRLLQY